MREQQLKKSIIKLEAQVSAQAEEIARLREFERAHVENDQVYGQPMVSQRLADNEAQAACEARNDAADSRRKLETAEARLSAVRGAFDRCSHKRHPDGTIYEVAYYILYDEIKSALTSGGTEECDGNGTVMETITKYDRDGYAFPEYEEGQCPGCPKCKPSGGTGGNDGPRACRTVHDVRCEREPEYAPPDEGEKKQ